MFTVYAIYNRLRDKLYIGQTNNIAERLLRHNGTLRSKSTSYTHINSGDWKLVYREDAESRIEAMRREKELKSFRGRQFIRSKIGVASSIG